ncbi:MAG: sigma 54-interacting transcriptional regulator [Desulfovibrio sp.]|nr:sigma 54-interacting transcriptional regulator [Desulfovibrio sp.]
MDTSQTERENIRVQARLDKLLNRLPDLVYRCKIEGDFTYRLEYASAGSENLLGIPASEMMDKRWNTVERMTHPADLERMRSEIYDKIVAHEPWQVMYRLKLPDGRIKWIWDQGEAIYAEDGTPLYLEGIMLDVSEQKFQELALQNENRQLKLSLEQSERLGDIVGKSDAMHKMYSLILKAAETETNVIIYGETGCGKEMVSRAIHNYSGRKGKYVPVNCGAIPENLLESEFFGYAKGAFTGAVASKEGFIAAADNGSLFLDEIGELPVNLQVKFLRVLETKTYTPLGCTTPQRSNFRLIAATHRDLAEQVRDGRSRADFYYRINVLTITVPPLRERKEDLPLLVKAWCERNGIDLPITKQVRLAMSHHTWPGNVRELNNFLDRFAVFGESAVDFLNTPINVLPETVKQGQTLDDAMCQMEKRLILNMLEQCRWRRGKTAQALGLNLRTLQRKMKALGIEGEKMPPRHGRKHYRLSAVSTARPSRGAHGILRRTWSRTFLGLLQSAFFVASDPARCHSPYLMRNRAYPKARDYCAQ